MSKVKVKVIKSRRGYLHRELCETKSKLNRAMKEVVSLHLELERMYS